MFSVSEGLKRGVHKGSKGGSGREEKLKGMWIFNTDSVHTVGVDCGMLVCVALFEGVGFNGEYK